jgi:uncharacterized protein (TIGR02231 family)
MPSIHAPIQAVTVFQDSARVTRRGAAQLAAGEQVLEVDGLPAAIDDRSMRASGRGAGARILGVEVARQYVADAPESALAEAARRVEELQDAIRALDDDDAALAEQAQFLAMLRERGGASLAKAIARGQATLDGATALSQYLTRESAAAAAARRDLAARKRQLARQLEAAQARLNDLQHRRPLERRQARVAIAAAAATNFELELTYVVGQASWAPVYDLRLEENGDRLALTYLAEVRQASGEDWTGVALALSTARPAAGTELPELEAWYVDLYQPPPPPPPRPPSQPGVMRAAAAPAPAPDMLSAGALMEDSLPSAEVATASVEAGGAAVTYRIERPADVPADGAPHTTAVALLDLPARIDHLVVPKLAEEAVLRARVVNNSPYQLLAGRAALFHGANFVGAADLDLVAPSESFEVQLGVDDRVRVERKLVERSVSKTLIGNARHSVYAYRIALKSHADRPLRATVCDQLPVARHEDIKVRLQDASPRPAEQTDLGILKWEMELAPQVEAVVQFSFTVDYPRERRLVGLNE